MSTAALFGADLAMLLHRDLLRLGQQIDAFPSQETLWAIVPGVSNSAGHLVLHLEGNLHEYIGRVLGALPYTRNRPQEFDGPVLTQGELATRIAWLAANIPPIVAALTGEQLEAEYPQNFMGRPLTTRAMLIHLYGHFNWHLGQIDYLRRVLSASGAINLVSLSFASL